MHNATQWDSQQYGAHFAIVFCYCFLSHTCRESLRMIFLKSHTPPMVTAQANSCI